MASHVVLKCLHKRTQGALVCLILRTCGQRALSKRVKTNLKALSPLDLGSLPGLVLSRRARSAVGALGIS